MRAARTAYPLGWRIMDTLEASAAALWPARFGAGDLNGFRKVGDTFGCPVLDSGPESPGHTFLWFSNALPIGR